MTKTEEAESLKSKENKVAIGSLTPNESEVSSNHNTSVDDETKLAVEKSLIETTRLLLREYGIRKSGAAVREAVEIRHKFIGPKEAVSSIINFGFKASFGNIKLKNLSEDFFPLIAFHKNGEACLTIDDEPSPTDVV